MSAWLGGWVPEAAAAGAYFPWLADAVLRSTLWLLAAWGIDVGLRRCGYSASLRHAVAVVAAVGVPAVFAVSLLPVPAGAGWRPDLPREGVLVARAALGDRVAVVDAPDRAASRDRGDIREGRAADHPIAGVIAEGIVAAWAIGLLVGVGRFALAGSSGGAAGDRADQTSGGDLRLESVLARESALIGLSRPPRCRVACGCPPMIVGLLRPCLVLPAEARSWPDDRLAAVLRHECAHMRRGDVWWHLAGTACLLPLWFHPLAWRLRRSLAAMREEACDDAVLQSGIPAADYAGVLVGLMAGSPNLRASPRLGAAGHPDPVGRVRAILDPRRSRRPVAAWRAGMAGAAALLVACPATLLVGCASRAPERSPLTVRYAEPIPPEWADARLPADAELLGVRLVFTEVSVPAAQLDELPDLAAAVRGDVRVLSPEAGWQLFHVARPGTDLMSAPRIACRPGQEATVEVARDFIHPAAWEKKPEWPVEVPITFQTTQVGVIARIRAWPTPRPNRVRIELSPTIREFDRFDSPAGHPDRQEPVFITRGTEFEGEIENGSCLIIGHRTAEEAIEESVPVLGTLPLLGRPFRARRNEPIIRLAAVRVLVTEASDGK